MSSTKLQSNNTSKFSVATDNPKATISSLAIIAAAVIVVLLALVIYHIKKKSKNL